jgi:hypothetical protein
MINKKDLIIWILGSCIIFSTIFNIVFVYTIQQLRKPYNEQVILNEQKRKEIELTIDYRHEIQIEYMRSLIGRSFIDTIQNQLEQKYDLIQGKDSQQLVQHFTYDTQNLGGND